MRNLKLQYCDQVSTKVTDVKFLISDSTGDKQNAKLFLVTSDRVFATNERFENVKELANEANIVGAEYLAITDELCIATDDGRILSVDINSGAVNENSYCDVGLTKMAWSPEQEVVVFITKTNNVVVMTCTYDPISEHALQEQCEQEQQFVNVGWGRKETQFHGSEGKNAAKQKTNFEKPKEIEDVSSDIEISWRYDGAYFAVSFVSAQFGRMFKVFDKEGLLEYTSEKLNGLEAPIAWRPSGTWIAMPHAFPNKSTIALFEKNGLRHREIVLPFSFEKEKVCKLKWSNDSDILVIQTETLATEKKQQLYLYTIGNYHWYLKQMLNYEEGVEVNDFHFGGDSALERTLHVILNCGLYLRYRWYFDVDKYERHGHVAVIDGNSLLLTNLSKAIVPPPMSSMQLQIDANINACTFHESVRNKNILVYLYDANGNFHVNAIKTPFKSEPAMLKPDSDIVAEKGLGQLANITICSEEYIIATQCVNHATSFLLLHLDFTQNTYRIVDRLQQPGIFNAIHYNACEGQLSAHNSDKSTVFKFDITNKNKILICKDQQRLPHAATQILTFLNENKKISIIALCHNQSLFIDDHLVADYVTSFCLENGWQSQYLAFTKHTELSLVRLSNRTIDAVRSIESGGKLVTICCESSRAVLQMPRGNLEAFYPRLLLLNRVGNMLDGYEYEKIMDLLVKQRINLNIICDHDMISFIDNIPKFVDSIGNVQWLNLFLSDLRNEDITKTMYAYGYNTSPRAYPPEFQIEHKIEFICLRMLNYMENVDETKRTRLILPIITALVKMNDLEAALEIIWSLKKQETSTENTVKSQSEDALKYLLYLVDVNDLYNVALGTYDFGLVLFVAQKSQKDPREFLPFLNELKEFDVNYRQFKIDEHLKRYEKALKNISQCNEDERFEEALAFVMRHRLYNEALKLYEYQSENYKRICLAYADYLRAEGKLDNASLMYERGGDTAQALRCAKNSIDWQRVLSLAHLEDADKVATVALSLVPALQEKRLNAEAFHLLYTYGNSFEDALDCLLKGNLHLKAIYEARLYQAKNKSEADFIASKIKPSLEAYVQTLGCLLVEQEQTFLDYKQRLLTIREKRERQNDANGTLGNDEMFDECDLLSDTTSMRSSHYTASSRGTGKTFRSSKNRRKHERKHFSLKPGNPFEDIALIDALYGLILKIVEQQQHVHDTCKALLELRLDGEAMQIQKRFKQLIILMQNALNEIWTAELAVGVQQVSATEAAANMDYALFQNEQRYALLDPIKRFKPQIKLGDWEHAILK